MDTFESLAAMEVATAPSRRKRYKHREDVLPLAAVPIIQACIHGHRITVPEVAPVAGIHRASLGTMLGDGNNGKGAHLWFGEKGKRRWIKPCRENALIMMRYMYLGGAGAAALQERLGMTEAEIVAVIKKLPTQSEVE